LDDITNKNEKERCEIMKLKRLALGLLSHAEKTIERIGRNML